MSGHKVSVEIIHETKDGQILDMYDKDGNLMNLTKVTENGNYMEI